MPFPKVNRVIYEKNPLDRVICQLRFPPILKIDSEVPSEFQERIRDVFPLYNEKIEIIQGLSEGIRQKQDELSMPGIKKSITIKNHQFSNEDNTWVVNLTRTFLSITTSKYRVWEDFIRKFQTPIDSLVQVYNPAFFTRIGLRYIDIFNRSRLGLESTPWSELINPYFLGLLSSPVAGDIRNCEGKYEINLEDGESILRVITTFVDHLETKERCYLVDCDFFYPSRSNTEAIAKRLEFLHGQASRLIQFIIKDKLHKAMEPRNIE